MIHPPRVRPFARAAARHLARLGAGVLLVTAVAVVPRSAHGQFGTNLIRNPGAEAGGPGNKSGGVVSGGTIPDWTPENSFTVVDYGFAGYPTATNPGPADRGSNFFGGGNQATGSATQLLDLSSYGGLAALIDAGGVNYSLGAWLGGFSSQSDNMTFLAEFLDGSSSLVGSVTLGPVTVGERQSASGLLVRSFAAQLPALTRAVRFTMSADRNQGTSNDGYADNLSFVLRNTTQAVVPEPGTWAMLGAGLAALAATTRRRRTNA